MAYVSEAFIVLMDLALAVVINETIEQHLESRSGDLLEGRTTRKSVRRLHEYQARALRITLRFEHAVSRPHSTFSEIARVVKCE